MIDLRGVFDRLHRAITRPSTPPSVDLQARAEHRRRRERLERRASPLLELQAQANLERRDRGWRGDA